MQGLLINPGSLPPECEALRAEVRAFLAEAMVDVSPLRRNRNWSGADPAFSRKMGERGWLGMTWPKRYGGHERSMLERFTEITSQLQASEHCRLLVPEKLQQCLEESPTYLKLKRLSGNYQNAKSQFTDLFCTWLGNGNTGQEFDVPRKP